MECKTNRDPLVSLFPPPPLLTTYSYLFIIFIEVNSHKTLPFFPYLHLLHLSLPNTFFFESWSRHLIIEFTAHQYPPPIYRYFPPLSPPPPSLDYPLGMKIIVIKMAPNWRTCFSHYRYDKNVYMYLYGCIYIFRELKNRGNLGMENILIILTQQCRVLGLKAHFSYWALLWGWFDWNWSEMNIYGTWYLYGETSTSYKAQNVVKLKWYNFYIISSR